MTLHWILKEDSSSLPPIDQFTILNQPLDITTVVGDSALFSVTTQHGIGPYRFVWQGFTAANSTWTNLRDISKPESYDSYTYTTNPPIAGQQRIVRVLITDTSDQTTLQSNEATMTVIASPAPVTTQVSLTTTSPYTYNFASGGVSDPDGAANIVWDELTLVSGSTQVKRSQNIALTTANGSWTMNSVSPPTVTFVPNGSFASGTDTISYFVKDVQNNTSNTSLMSVTVTSTGSGTLRIVPIPPETYQRPSVGQVDAYVTNRSQLDAFMNGSGVSAILANGEYLSGLTRLSFKNKSNKKLWAENLHQASFEYANMTDANKSNSGVCISCAGASFIELHGLRASHGRYYGIVLSGNTNFDAAPSNNILASHCLVENMYMGAVKMDNGSDTSFPAYKSHHLTFQYGIIRNIGLQWPADSTPYFCEGIYMGSGSVSDDRQSVEFVTIKKNLIQPNTLNLTYDNRVSGEAIEAKIGCKNIDIIGNDIENLRLGISTSGAAIAIWINTLEADPGSIIIEGNRIRNVQRTTESGIWGAGNGIVFGVGATARNNIITGCADSGLRFMMKATASNGVFPNNAAWRNVLLEHNVVAGCGANFSVDTGQGPQPTVISRGNLYQSVSYPSGPNFTTTQDTTFNLANLIGTTATPSTFDDQSKLRPNNDNTLVYTGTSSVAYDINGNVRPFGTNKHYGASEA